MLSNFLASSGNCELMSPPRNMLSRYIHFLCTSSQTCKRHMFSAGTLWTNSRVMGDLDTLSDLYGLTDQGQVFLPLLYGTKERSNKTTAGHALQVHGIVVQIKHNLIHCANHRATFPSAFDIWQHTERHVSPGLHHLLYSLEAHTDMFDDLTQLIPRSSLRWFTKWKLTFSIPSSFIAEVTISPMTSAYLCNSIANMFSRVKVSRFISKFVPVLSISSFQCLRPKTQNRFLF